VVFSTAESIPGLSGLRDRPLSILRPVLRQVELEDPILAELFSV
jgi:hypothetical protein